MGADIKKVQRTRRKFRPELPIMTLFVGESAPDGPQFFYFRTSPMFGFMKKAVDAAAGRPSNDFLAAFKGYGWYLDDLVTKQAVNKLPRRSAARRAACRDARHSLAARIARYRPALVVSLMRDIDEHVAGALSDAQKMVDFRAEFLAMPFPGNGHQNDFHSKMLEVFAVLPKHTRD